MKNRILPIITMICLLALLLTACTGSGNTATSWGGATITDSAVYFADGTMIYALKSENGNTIWSYPEKASATRAFLAAPVVAGEQLLVGDIASNLTSLSIRNGKQNWQFEDATGKYIDSPLVVGEMIIAPNADGTLYALDLNGNKVWTFTAEHSFWAQPVTDGQIVYAPSLDHFLYALDLATGELKWKTELKASLVARPTLLDGTIYIGNLDGQVFAVDSGNGDILWEQEVAGGVWSAPLLIEGQLYFGDQTGMVYVLNAADGSITSSFETESPMLGSGVSNSEGVFFGNEKGELVLFGFDGSKKWSRPVDVGAIYSNLVINNDMIIVVTNKGEKPMVALNTEGNEIWYFTTK